MNTLAIPDLERLARLLGMLGSDHLGERDNAGQLADKMVRAAVGCRRCRACGEVFVTGAGRAACSMPDGAGCLFRPRVLPERAGVPEEIVSPPWARGLDIRTARGWQWYQLLQHADGDPTRLRQIQVARGYKSSWVRYAVQEAAEKRAARGVAA
jgi:hypothetical protein